MIRRASSIFLLIAWLCANGALLDVMQVFAWGKMFAGYSHLSTLREAVSRTFDSGRPCELCRAIQKARAAEQGRRHSPADTAKSAGVQKMVLSLEQTARALIALPTPAWAAWDEFARLDPVKAVPVPPPRFGSGSVLS